MFDQQHYLESCFELPTREPRPYWKPERKKVPPRIAEIALLTEHQNEVEALYSAGVPTYLARAMVLNKYCDSRETVNRRVKAQTQELRR